LHAHIHNHLSAIHARHVARRASYGGGSSGYYTSGYGSSGGSSGGYGSSGHGSVGHHYGSTGSGSSGGGSSGGYHSGPVYSSRYQPVSGYASTSVTSNSFATNDLATIDPATGAIPSDEIQISLSVPSDAKIMVNGKPTSSTGSLRRFVSRDLNPNESYRFDIQATYKVDGKDVSQTRSVIARSGGVEQVVFDTTKNDDPVETMLTLNVPEGATVVLANNPTKSEGASRVYRTKQLKSGEVWDDYKIEVTYAGKTKEKTIRLIGGDKLEMSFNFDQREANKIASN